MPKDIQAKAFERQGLFVIILAFALLFGAACSTNLATGERQFTALMSPQQEASVGASEHEKIVAQFGLYKDPQMQAYLDRLGARLAKGTERADVSYKFYIIDSPIVNAFALPGGYVYVSRGLLALANNEAELAGVVGHEIGHITGRHSAERYSTSVVTSLGAGLIAAAVDSSSAAQALGLGSNLFLSSYSRSQENQADTLGIRYLARANYDAKAMSSFLAALQRDSAFQAKAAGKNGNQFSYFSTHPATSDRVAKTMAEARQYPQDGSTIGRNEYLIALDGLIFGDSAAQGFVRGQRFYHPGLGFTLSAPDGFRMINQPTQVVASAKNGAVMVFDMKGAPQGGGSDPFVYLTKTWMKDKVLKDAQRITVNGLPAATASFAGTVNKRPVTIRLVSIAWQGRFVRFQLAIPQGSSAALVEDLKRASYSFRNMKESEKASVKPYKVKMVVAKSGESVGTMAARQVVDEYKEDLFRLLNGLASGQGVIAGQSYKVVME